MTATLAHITGTGWDDWAIAIGPVAAFMVIAAMLMRPRGGDRSPLAAAAHGLERITGIPGWVAGAFGTGIGGLTVAVIGFYWDVAWHIDRGRDNQLLTPPHTMILMGLGAIALAAGVGIVLASATKAETRLRFRGFRLPWSAVLLGVIGAGAVAGFPLDDLWHRAYGVDVTMWGPTHLIMIGGASITTIALWLVLAEGGVRPGGGGFPRVLHTVAAGAAMAGLSALQGEFDFGVPQFQLLYHPVLILAAAAIGLTAARIVLGRGGAVKAALGFVAIRGAVALLVHGLGFTAPHFPLYLAPAIAVELVALAFGTDRLRRFALGAGLGVVTIGFAGEWAWTHVWFSHPWKTSLLPDAAWAGALAAFGGATIGTALGAIASGRASEAFTRGDSLVPRRAIAGGLIAATAMLAVALALPIKRVPSVVSADLAIRRAGDIAFVELQMHPADAAKNARWFELLVWQGGTLQITPLEQTAPGHYRATKSVPVTGKAKALIRLHRGAEMSAVPVRFPADPEIGAAEIPPVDRTARFERDTLLIMREAHRGNPLTARIVFAVLSAIVVAWLVVLAVASAGIVRRRPRPTRVEEVPRAA